MLQRIGLQVFLGGEGLDIVWVVWEGSFLVVGL